MSEEALKRIAECQRTQAKKLNLSDLGLEELPMELGELTWLEDLDLSRNPITRPPTPPKASRIIFSGTPPSASSPRSRACAH